LFWHKIRFDKAMDLWFFACSPSTLDKCDAFGGGARAKRLRFGIFRIQAGSKRRNPSGNVRLVENQNKESAKDFLEHPGPFGCQSPKELIKVVKHFLKLAVSGREDGWLS
jgi:hypothetical protein